MLLAVYFALIILCVICPRSQKIFYVLSIFLWFVAAFCVNNADYDIYYRRYYTYFSSDATEFGYNLILAFFNKLGFQFQTFLYVIYAFIIGVVALFIKRNTENCALAMALYAIFPYCIDVVQLRNTLSWTFCLIGIDFLLEHSDDFTRKYAIVKKWKKQLAFIVCIILAVQIHFASILFLIILIPYNFNFIMTAICTLSAIAILAVVTDVSFITTFATLFTTAEKVDAILRRIAAYSFDNILNIMLVMIVPTIILLVILFIAKYDMLGLLFLEEQKKRQSKIAVISLMQKIQLISLIILPLVSLNLDVYRIHRYLLFLGCFGATIYGTTKFCKYIFNKGCYYLLLIFSVIAFFYVQIYKLNNFETTFYALFTNNMFF